MITDIMAELAGLFNEPVRIGIVIGILAGALIRVTRGR